MDATTLRQFKGAAKALAKPPSFKPIKRGKFPRPFHRMGGSRLTSTGLLEVGADCVAILFARDGDTFTDTAFLGFLMYRLPTDELTPLFEFHWHPGHKGFHCKTPCRDDRVFTSRQLPGVQELNMKTKPLDVRNADERQELVVIFCRACGISVGWVDDRQRSLTL